MFSEKLKALRMKRNISQAKLATILGLTQQAIGGWETNKSSPDYDTLKKIAKLFDVSIDDLMDNNLHTDNKLSNPILMKLNQKGYYDICQILDEFINYLDRKNAEILYNGNEKLDDETRELILQSLKLSAGIAKQRTKLEPKKDMTK